MTPLVAAALIGVACGLSAWFFILVGAIVMGWLLAEWDSKR